MSKNNGAIRLIVIILLLTVVFQIPGTATAAENSTDITLWFTVYGSSQEGLQSADVACWYSAKEKKYFLFLPSMADPSELQVHFADGLSVSAGSQKLRNGGVTQVFQPKKTVSVRINGKSYPIQVMQSSGIPALWIKTEKRTLKAIHAKKTNKEPAKLLMLSPEGQTVYRGALSHLKARGHYSFNLEKKPYQIKLDTSADLLGFGSAKKWILLANTPDYTLLRNTITFDMASDAGLQYSPANAHVDLYIDGEYKGVYLLTDKIEVGKDRVAISDLQKATERLNDKPLDQYKRFGNRNYKKDTGKGYRIPIDPLDITGGYLLELDYPNRYIDAASGFVTKRGQAVNIKEPELASEKQVYWIRSMVQAFENALRANNGTDKATGKYYADFIDMDSFVKKFILEEVVKNLDANKSSQYFYKPPDHISDRLFAGPAWDYDSALGNFAPQYNPKFMLPQNLCAGTDTAMGYYWWSALYRQPDFYSEVLRVYHEVYVPLLNVLAGSAEGTGRLMSVDAYAKKIEAATAMNFIRWPMVKNRSNHVNAGTTYQDQIKHLKDFITKRAMFLDATWK